MVPIAPYEVQRYSHKCIMIYISETVRARTLKLVNNMSDYCTQIKFVLNFSHAHFHNLISMKIQFLAQ